MSLEEIVKNRIAELGYDESITKYVLEALKFKQVSGARKQQIAATQQASNFKSSQRAH